MLTLSSTDLDALLVMFFFPFARILAWLAVDPLLGNKSIPLQLRVLLGFVLTVAIAPILPPPQQVALVSGAGLLTLLQQIAIGLVMGFCLRIVFAIIELAGQFISMQMGLSFATLFDPINGAQTPVVGQFLVIATSLILFAFNGHHLVIAALAQSFIDIPIGTTLSTHGLVAVVRWSAIIFTAGVHIALPVTAALLATNLTIGMMSRAAPQLNIFAIGFPLTLGVGFIVLYLTLAYLPTQLDHLWLQAVDAGSAAMRGVAAP